MADHIIINKTQSILRCIRRIEDDYFGFEDELESNFMRQDAILLNLQRACEQSISLAIHLAKILKLEIPRDSKSTFDVILQENILSKELALAMKKMVGFRNIAVHEYHKINLDIVRSIIENNLMDFKAFVQVCGQFI